MFSLENRFLGSTILSQGANSGEQGGHHGGGTIVQYSGQDGSLVSYVPGNRHPLKHSFRVYFL